jgi:hypothetical protein
MVGNLHRVGDVANVDLQRYHSAYSLARSGLLGDFLHSLLD